MFKNLIAVAGLATVLSSSVVNACESYEEVTSAWLPIMQTTAYYVAIEEGLFEKGLYQVRFQQNAVAKSYHRRLSWWTGGFWPPGRCRRDRYASRGKISRNF